MRRSLTGGKEDALSLTPNPRLLANVHGLRYEGVYVCKRATHVADAVVKRNRLEDGLQFMQIVPNFVDAALLWSDEASVGIECSLLHEKTNLRGALARVVFAV